MSLRQTNGVDATALSAQVLNSTDEPKLVELKLVGTDPHGIEVSRPLGKRRVAPKAALDLAIPIRDLPVQSAGEPSPLSLDVTYELALLRPDGSKAMLQHTVHSSPLYLTFTDDFSKANAKTPGDQAQSTSASSGVAAAGRLKLRHFNAKHDRIEDAPASTPDGEVQALIGITNVAPGPLPHLPDAI